MLIENSTFYNTGNGSFITASRSNETDAYGYVMKDCTIDGEAGITAFSFGRQQSTSAKAVFINTALKMDIIDGHWTAGSAAPALFGEYNTVDKNNQVISTGDMTVGSGSSQFTAKVLSADEAPDILMRTSLPERDGIRNNICRLQALLWLPWRVLL